MTSTNPTRRRRRAPSPAFAWRQTAQVRQYLAIFFGLLLLVPELASQSDRPVGIERPEVVEQWLRGLERAEESLEIGDWKKARRATQTLLSDMCDRIEGGEGVARLLGIATLLRAVSEAGLGNERAARWDLTLATSLMPSIAEIDMARFGPPGDLVGSWWNAEQASPASEAERDSKKPRSMEAVIPPKKVRTPQPQYPFGKYQACVDGPIEVEMVIDREGLPTRPRVLTTQDPLLAFAALETLRDWRFKPARYEGEAISVYLNVTVNFRLSRCKNLFAGVKNGREPE